jgi:hypothetical protein
MLLLYSKTAWNDYFPGSYTNFNSQTYTSRQTPSYTGVYVSNCLFGPITSSSDGGTLYCDSSVQYLLVESSSFFSCKSSGGAGVILFNSQNNGQSVFYAVCGYDCCCTSSYNVQFGHTHSLLFNTTFSSYFLSSFCGFSISSFIHWKCSFKSERN